jgi:hypothetical protein
MVDLPKPYKMIVDFATSRQLPEVGAEANRQAVERFLVLEKGYEKADIEVDVGIAFEVAGQPYRSQLDLVVSVPSRETAVRYMVIKCAPGSLGSCVRETVSAARLLDRHQIPLAVVSNGRDAIVVDTLTAETIGQGLPAIPSRVDAQAALRTNQLQPYPVDRLERERLIFRTYNSEYVNVARNLPPKESSE